MAHVRRTISKKAWIAAAALAVLVAGGYVAWRQRHPAAHVHPAGTVYYCPMHPQIRQDAPGTCPICSMDLVPLEEEDGVGEEEGTPASLEGLPPVRLSSWKRQLVGVRLEKAARRPLVRTLRAPGRAAGGGFAALAGEFAAGEGVHSGGGGRALVADVYALDIPYVRVGQKALVSSFDPSGGKVEGVVGRIYPYDEAQSRVVRVRVDLKGSATPPLFANMEILAETAPRLSIPREAVLDSGLERYVFVDAGGGLLEPRRVELGFLGDDFVEVASGLREGESVVVGAGFLVEAESRLKAALRGMAHAAEEREGEPEPGAAADLDLHAGHRH